MQKMQKGDKKDMKLVKCKCGSFHIVDEFGNIEGEPKHIAKRTER